ncbi:MAG: lamin tail domain-containing protein, partial [Bradymonadaceae bacterium]
LDAGTADARVITGSFNWSSAATISNDEVLLVLHGKRIAERYLEEFRNIWSHGKEVGEAMCNYMIDNEDLRCGSRVRPGDVVISEIHWDGWNGQRDPSDHTSNFRRDVTNDQFIELYNNTEEPINLSMWTLSNGHDVIMGFTPGTVILPGQYFLVLDHNTVPLSERDPQRGQHAFENPDFVLNMANDPRFRRLNFKSAYMNIMLRDSRARVIDRAGDGSPPFFGGRHGEINYSMERRIPESGPVPDGTLRQSWKISSGIDGKGGENVAEDFRDFIIATPGAPNSP